MERVRESRDSRRHLGQSVMPRRPRMQPGIRQKTRKIRPFWLGLRERPASATGPGRHHLGLSDGGIDRRGVQGGGQSRPQRLRRIRSPGLPVGQRRHRQVVCGG